MLRKFRNNLIIVTALAASGIMIPAAMLQAAEFCNCTPLARSYAPPVVRHVRPTPRFDNRGHQTNWMQSQGFSSCSQVRRSCYRGANKPGHGLAYAGVCEDRFQVCMQT